MRHDNELLLEAVRRERVNEYLILRPFRPRHLKWWQLWRYF